MDSKDERITALQNEIIQLKQQLEKYTNNERHKKYYEKNKERVKQNAREYLNKLKEQNPERLKEYRHRAYLKRKERLGITNESTIETTIDTTIDSV
jgi:hypothetical protein